MDQDGSRPKTVSLLVCSGVAGSRAHRGRGRGPWKRRWTGNTERHPVGGPEINAYIGGTLSLNANGQVVASLSYYLCNVTLFVYEFKPPSTQSQLRGSTVPITGDNKATVFLSADGNLVVASTRTNVNAFRDSYSWNLVGSRAAGDDNPSPWWQPSLLSQPSYCCCWFASP